jgi:hypothetical protein
MPVMALNLRMMTAWCAVFVKKIVIVELIVSGYGAWDITPCSGDDHAHVVIFFKGTEKVSFC